MPQRYRLTPGMFGTFGSPVKGMVQGDFHLTCHQFREDDFCHNAEWRNGSGENIGMGDLSMHDLRCIANLLEDGEIFIVLPEGSKPQGPTEVARLARFAVMHMKFFTVNQRGRNLKHIIRGTRFKDINFFQMLFMMRESNPTIV